jgi:hypothetical protein
LLSWFTLQIKGGHKIQGTANEFINALAAIHAHWPRSIRVERATVSGRMKDCCNP